jgi:hydrogenase-4 membrane subunit HyfE
MSNIFDMEPSMPNLSYQEKSLYGELLADLAVFVPYFIYIHIRHTTVGFIAGSITILILIHIVLQTIIAVATRNRLKDERDQLIRLRGYRAGYFTAIGFMVVGMAALWLHTTFGDLNPSHMALHFLSVFYAVLMIAELVKTITQLMDYRRGL